MKLLKTFAVVLVIVAATLLATADRSVQIHASIIKTAGAPFLTPPCTDDIAAIEACPLTGCGESGDAELNKAKNRTDSPATIISMTLDDIRQLPQPRYWNTGAERSSIRGAGREGTGVAVNGFLLRAKAEGKESCNCGLSRRVDTDVHLVLVSKLPDSESKEAIDGSEKGSVTAEITPRVRGRNEKWLYRNVNDLEGSYIRVTGLLMLDTRHIAQSRLLQGERINRPLSRTTNWEIHPITKLEVCTKSQRSCDNGSGWKKY